MKTFVVASVFLYMCCSAQAFWWPCDGLTPPDHVESAHCNEERCIAVRGEELTARVYITGTAVHHELMVTATVFLGGVGVNIPTTPPHDNGCNSLFIGNTQVSCPTQPNVQYTWVVSEVIPTTLPAFQNARLMYTITDRGSVVGCVNLLATLI